MLSVVKLVVSRLRPVRSTTPTVGPPPPLRTVFNSRSVSPSDANAEIRFCPSTSVGQRHVYTTRPLPCIVRLNGLLTSAASVGSPARPVAGSNVKV